MSEDEVKNPNLNEAGRPLYPKWVEHPSEKDTRGFPKRILVKNKKEEDALLAGGKPEKQPVKNNNWP